MGNIHVVRFLAGWLVPLGRPGRPRPRGAVLRGAAEGGRLARARAQRRGRRRRHGGAQRDGARLRRARQSKQSSKLLNEETLWNGTANKSPNR